MKYHILFGGFIVLLLGLYIFIPNSSFIPDIWFHLLRAQQFLNEGLQLWDTQTFQPYGRPILYPPLWSIFLAGIAGIFGWYFTIYILGPVLLIFFLFTLYIFGMKYFSLPMALIIALSGTLSVSGTLSYLSLMPAAIVVILGMWLFMAFDRSNIIVSIILLTMMFYIHLVFPWLFVLALGWYVFRNNPGKKQLFAKVVIGSIVFYVPWLVWMGIHIDAFNVEMMWNNNPMPGWKSFSILSHYSINLVYFPLSILGLYLLRNENHKGLAIARAILIGMLPIIPLYGGRYTWHIMPFFYLFPIYYLATKTALKKMKLSWTQAPVVLGLCAILIIPMIEFSFASFKDKNVLFSYSWTAINIPLLNSEGLIVSQDFKDALNAVSLTPEHALISGNNPHIASVFCFFSEKKCDYGLFWENSDNDTIREILHNRESHSPMIFVYENEEIPYNVHYTETFGTLTVGYRL